MEKVSVNNLKKLLNKRSSLVGIPGLMDLLSFNEEEFSADEVFESILRMALEKFEYYEPLITSINIYIDYGVKDHYSFIDNVASVIKGIVSEDNLEMIPNSVIGLTKFRQYSDGYRIRVQYESPKMYRTSMSSAQYLVKGIFNRPLIIEYDSTKSFTDNCWLCFMAENRGEKWGMFMKQLLLSFLDYIYNIKTNMTIPDLPLEIFGAIETVKSDLATDLETYYKETLSNGSLLT